MGLALQELALESTAAAWADRAACSLGFLSLLQFLGSYFGTIDLFALTLPESKGSVDGQDGLLECSNKFVGSQTVGGRVVVGVEPLLCGLAHPVEGGGLHQLFSLFPQHAAHLLVSELHAETELAEVLEQRVVEAGTLSLLVLGVGRRGDGSRVDRRAACSVGNHLAVAEELADELHVRRLTATRASTRELEERLGEL